VNTLLVDYSYITIRYSFAEDGVKYLLKYLASIVAKYPSIDKIAFVGDSPPYNRRVKCPMYKQNRPPNPNIDRIIYLRQELSKILFELKVDVYKGESLEADDIIGSFVVNYCKPTMCKKLLIVSNDSDLYQLLKYDNSIIFFGNGNVEFGLDVIKDKLACRSAEEVWKSVIYTTAITSGHNNLPKPRKGIGIKRALTSYLDYNRNINQFLFTEEELSIIEQNIQLSIIPYKDTLESSDCVAATIYHTKTRACIPNSIRKLSYSYDVIPTLLRVI